MEGWRKATVPVGKDTRPSTMMAAPMMLAAAEGATEQDAMPDNHVIKVRDRRITIDSPTLIQNNVATDTVTLDLDEEWEGVAPVIILGPCESPVQLTWNGKPVLIPASLMYVVGGIDVSVMGYDDDGTMRLVTAAATGAMNVIKSGCFSGGVPPETPPDLLGQLVSAASRAQASAESADAASESANGAASLAKAAAGDAKTAAKDANGAAGAANEAANKANAIIVQLPLPDGNMLRGTKSGNVVSVDDAYAAPPVGLKVLGATRQNLWVNPSGTSNGVTVTSNDDGTFTASGTGTADNSVQAYDFFSLKPSTAYTVECDKAVEGGRGFYIREKRSDKSQIIVRWFGGTMNPSTKMTFTTDSEFSSFDTAIGYSNGVTISGTYRVMLREATEDEIAAAQQTASTLQEGGTADLSQDYPVFLPTDPSVYADTGNFDWCPPGINGVEPTAIVTAGKNLASDEVWKNGYWTESGDWVETGSGSPYKVRKPIKVFGDVKYVASLYNLDGTAFYARLIWLDVSQNFLTRTEGTTAVEHNKNVEVPAGASWLTWFGENIVYQGFQLELGTEATDYEPPTVTETPIDMQGHALYLLPSGTRDVLTADSAGSLTIAQSIGDIASYDGEDVGTEWMASSLNADGTPATGAHVIYKLSEPQTVDLGTVGLSNLPTGSANVWAVSDVPAEVEMSYIRDINIVIGRLEAAQRGTEG